MTYLGCSSQPSVSEIFDSSLSAHELTPFCRAYFPQLPRRRDNLSADRNAAVFLGVDSGRRREVVSSEEPSANVVSQTVALARLLHSALRETLTQSLIRRGKLLLEALKLMRYRRIIQLPLGAIRQRAILRFGNPLEHAEANQPHEVEVRPAFA